MTGGTEKQFEIGNFHADYMKSKYTVQRQQH